MTNIPSITTAANTAQENGAEQEHGKGKSAVASAAFSDRAVLWNAVEKIEKPKTPGLRRKSNFPCPRN